MKKLFVILVGIVFNATFFTACANDWQNAPFLSQSFPAASIKAVEVSTSGGSITVTGDAEAEAVVEIYISRNNWSDERIRQAFEEDYVLDLRVEGGKLYAVAKSKNSLTGWNRQTLSISFKISVPKRIDSNLKTSGGGIRISDMSGTQDFRTSGGSLTVENISGKVLGTTSGGSITVTNSSNVINLKTSGGSITARDCSGDIKLSTSGGSIKLTNLDGNIQTSTSGGSITANNINGTLNTGTSGGSVTLNGISGSVNAKTVGGSMTVEMQSVNDAVKLSNSGVVNLTLPIGKGYDLNVRGNKIETSGLQDFRGNIERDKLEGVVGNGEARIDIKTSQRVNLTFK